MLLSASVERFGVSRRRDFYFFYLNFFICWSSLNEKSQIYTSFSLLHFLIDTRCDLKYFFLSKVSIYYYLMQLYHNTILLRPLPFFPVLVYWVLKVHIFIQKMSSSRRQMCQCVNMSIYQRQTQIDPPVRWGIIENVSLTKCHHQFKNKKWYIWTILHAYEQIYMFIFFKTLWNTPQPTQLNSVRSKGTKQSFH